RSGANAATWDLRSPTTMSHAASITIEGAELFAKLSGNGGDDHVYSSSSETDVISGGDGNDTLEGQSSTSILRGDAGDDTLNGGAGGTLTMDGGAGNDTFHGGGHAGTTLYGLTSGSTDIVDGTPVIDFTGAPQNIIFLFQSGHLLAHWG